MSLHWYTCISTNTYCFEMHHTSLETDWWALPNASLIMQICSAVHEILADKAFTATDVLISQLFVVTFVHPTYVQTALILGFLAQLSLWKLVYWLWRYKLNEVCDTFFDLDKVYFLLSWQPCPCALASYSLISIIHACTMCTPWGIHIPWCHSIFRHFPILLDSRSFQTALNYSQLL